MHLSSRLVLRFENSELPSLREMLNRATNTLEPDKWPAWLVSLDKEVDTRLKQIEEDRQSGASDAHSD